MRRSGSTAGWATAGRRASAGATISTTRASLRQSRFPTGCCPARKRAARSRASRPTISSMSLLARYDPGAGIGWHRDRDVFEEVVGISLGTPATLRFRRRTASGFRRASFEVAPRSAYLLSGEARHDWEHSIAPGDALRFSITFRTLSEKGRRIAASQADRNGSRRRNGSAAMRRLAAVAAARSRPVRKGREADLPVDRRGALARRRMGAGQRAGEPGQAHADLRRRRCARAARAASDRIAVADPADSRIRDGNRRRSCAEPDDAPPEKLRAHATKLKQIEDSLESA